MTATKANTHAWEGAAAFVGDVGSTAPTDISTALDAAWEDLGFLSEEGSIVRGVEHETDRFYATHLAGVVLLKTINRKFRPYCKIMVHELDSDIVHGLYNGDAAATGGTRPMKVPIIQRKAFVLELVEGSVTRRMVFPDAAVAEVGEIEHSVGTLSGLELTLDLFPDATGTYGTEILADA